MNTLDQLAMQDLPGILASLGQTIVHNDRTIPASVSAVKQDAELQPDGIAMGADLVALAAKTSFTADPKPGEMLTYGSIQYRITTVREDGVCWVIDCVEAQGRRREGV